MTDTGTAADNTAAAPDANSHAGFVSRSAKPGIINQIFSFLGLA